MQLSLRARLVGGLGLVALACSSHHTPALEAAGNGAGGAAAGTGAALAGDGAAAGAGANSAGGMGGLPSLAGSGGEAGESAGSAGAPNAWTPSKCKRGIAVNDVSVKDLNAFGPNVKWFYDWGDHLPGTLSADAVRRTGLEFTPMVYGGEPDVAGVVASIPSDSHYLLGFNEPNFHAEGNLSAAAAAALWPKLEAIAAARELDLVGPAVNYCGPASTCWDTDPFSYLDAFFAACPTCRVDYVAVHWYACDAGGLEWYLGQAKKYGKPIWLTEFNCPGGDAAAQAAYMKIALPILEAEPLVFRYSWLMARSTSPAINLLAADGELTPLGQIYVSAPTSPDCAAESPN